VTKRAFSLWGLLAFLLAGGCGDDEPVTPPEVLHEQAVLEMGRFDFEAAEPLLARIVRARPDWLEVRVDWAIALLNKDREDEGGASRPLAILAEVLAKEPENLRAHYCSAILRLNQGDLAQALAHFERVARADPDDAYAAYFTGQCLAGLDRPEEALPWFLQAQALDPYLNSANYGAFAALQGLGRMKEGMAHLEAFQRLKDNPQERLAQVKYTRMGEKAMVVSYAPATPRPVPPLEGEAFAPARPLRVEGAQGARWKTAAGASPSLTAADLDGDGETDLFAADALEGPKPNAVLLRTQEGFTLDLAHPLAGVPDVRAALWGDYDNDGLTDVYLCRRGPNRLIRRTEGGAWEDVTEATRTGGGDLDSVDGAFLDADHDGDLDLFVVNANGKNELWNNNLDGTFRPLSDRAPIGGDGRPSIGVVVADLDRDRDVDLLVLKDAPPHEAWRNDRLWAWEPMPGTEALCASPLRAALAVDLDADGQVEVIGVSVAQTPTTQVWRRERGPEPISPTHQFTLSLERPHPLPTTSAAPSAFTVAAADFLGDGGTGWVASPGVGEGQGQAFRLGPEAQGLRLVPVCLDPVRGPSLVGLGRAEGPLVFGPGPGRHRFLHLSFSGQEDKGAQMRSNASGIGVTVALRVAFSWTVRHTFRAHSGPGQSLMPLAAGLRGEDALTYAMLTWPDGLLQSEGGLAAGAHHRIQETQRQTSSCPVLFAWNGKEHVFVTDCLGVGGIGFLWKPGEYVPPTPRESVLLPEGALAPREGRFVLKLGEPMEEACYLDGARLLVHDLPPGWKMAVDERMAVAGPPASGAPLLYREERLPSRVVDRDGRDVTRAVTEADLEAAPLPPKDRRFLGRIAPASWTLEFDAPLDPGPGAPWLVVDGWVEYPYAQTMFAAWQAGASYDAPTLEARGEDGTWSVVQEQFGYPAGMPRRMAFPLGALPAGAQALRLSTNMEVYFDRIAVARVEACPQARVVEAPLRIARLGRVGFARRSTGPQMQPHYDYARRKPFWDARHQEGLYTRFGDVRDLVAEVDDAVAVFGPGEEVHLEFDGSTAPLPEGWSRRHVLVLNGWCKDMDLYTKDGETVGPLPLRDGSEGSAERDRLHARSLIRFESGR